MFPEYKSLIFGWRQRPTDDYEQYSKYIKDQVEIENNDFKNFINFYMNQSRFFIGDLHV